MNFNLLLSTTLICILSSSLNNKKFLMTNGQKDERGWTSLDYPDIRAKPWHNQCGKHVPVFGYVCDPSPEAIISRHDAYLLNQMLVDLARSTKCECQRLSQCMTRLADQPGQVKVGFVVAVAFVHKLTSQGGTIYQAAEKFSKILRKRWGLGDCGNTAIILVWEEHQMVHISTDEELTKFYLTDQEAKSIVARVGGKIQNKEYLLALEQMLTEMKVQFNGERKKPTDVGTLALAISSIVAMVVVGIITACVCAFRCCGNLRNAPLKEAIERVESMKSELSRRNVPAVTNDRIHITDGASDIVAAGGGYYFDGHHSLV